MAHRKSKTKATKKLFLEKIAKVPIISVVCEQIGLSRATFYRWKNEDPIFDMLVENALGVGESAINDLCESKLVAKIQNSDNWAIKYWLDNHSKKYIKPKLTPGEIKRIQMPLVMFTGPDGIDYPSFEEFSIAEKKRIQKVVDDFEAKSS